MSALDVLLRIAGKDNFQLDPDIDMGYILRQCWKYGWMMVRGKAFSFGYEKIAKNVFVGKDVKVIEKKHLTIGQKTKLQDGVYIDALSRGGYSLETKWYSAEIRELNVLEDFSALARV